MGIDRKPVRYAHSDGHTDVCYSEDGSKLLTCGTDGDIRIWSGFNDDDPIQTCVGDWNLCIRQRENNIYVATDENTIQMLTYPEAERNGVLVRFTAHVNHIALGKNNYIAVASEDTEIKLINTSNSNEKPETITFSDVKGPPLSVALCPKVKYLAVSCGDGNLYIWNVNTRSLIQTFAVVPKTNSFMNAKVLCRIDFDPLEGRTLAYPDKNTIVILNTSDWSQKMTLSTSSVESDFSIVQYSPCSRFLAAASVTGDIVVWEVLSQNIIGATRHSKEIALCAMVWNPSGNGELAFCDVEGQLGIAENCCQMVDESVEQKIESEVQNEVDFSEYQFVDNEEDDENTVSIEKLKNEVMGAPEPELESVRASSRASSSRPRTPVTPLQSPFMPSSTPEHLNPRYMCWNDVGIIKSFGSDISDENKTIEVEFHDSNLHNSIIMPNFNDYTMGSLSTTALCVANTSQISVLPLSSGTKEWNLSVPESEEIICCACSERLICYASNTRMIRVSTVFGTQKGVFMAPGPIVSMAAKGDTLLVAYHEAAVRQGDMCIGILFVEFTGLLPSNRDLKCPLTPESTLQWIGLSETGTPAVQDSCGMLYLYLVNSNIWVPFCDTAKHAKNAVDGFFVTAVFETTQTLRGIRCRGSQYPGFTPRPTLSELPLEPVFSEMGTEKSQLEANLFTWSALHVEDIERKYKESALKLFALACKNDLDQRALELVEMLNNPQLVTFATKYATKMEKRRLAEKLMSIALKLQQSDVDNTSFNQIISTPNSTPNNVIKPKRLTLGSNVKLKQKTTRTQVEENLNNAKLEEERSSATNHSNLQSADLSTSSRTLNGDISVINSQESLFSQEETRNPFLKSSKKTGSGSYDPLNLTDKFAGCVEENKKEKNKENVLNNTPSEKRKKPDSDSSKSESEKPKDKQRKLDCFRFSKHTS